MTRLVALLLDAAVVSLSLAGVSWAVTSVRLLLLDVPSSRLEGLGPVAASITIGLTVFLYHIVGWRFAGRTPGKAFMGIQVVSAGGGGLTTLQAIIRFLGYLLSAVPLYAGFLWVILDDQRRAWHDLLARTRVVPMDGGVDVR